MIAAVPRPGVTRAALVLMAAGSGSRMGSGVNKVFRRLGGRTMLCWSLLAAARLPEVTLLLLVVADLDRLTARETLAAEAPQLDVRIVTGGSTRHASEWNAIQSLAAEIRRGEIDIVVVHDAARPLASTTLFADVVAAATGVGGAVPVRPQSALISLQGSRIVPHRDVVTVQTPQAFRAGPLLSAYERAAGSGFAGTDTSSSFEKFSGLPVTCVPAAADNIKVTIQEDLELADRLLTRRRSAGTEDISDPR
jgi:2-C-methyl-D-erythritol 4-phosphate cytidylyltransferase